MEAYAMNERLKFVQDASSDRFTLAELRARFGVRLPTGYEWIGISLSDCALRMRLPLRQVLSGNFVTGSLAIPIDGHDPPSISVLQQLNRIDAPRKRSFIEVSSPS